MAQKFKKNQQLKPDFYVSKRTTRGLHKQKRGNKTGNLRRQERKTKHHENKGVEVL